MSRINFFIGRGDCPNFESSEVVGSYVATLVSPPKLDILRIGSIFRQSSYRLGSAALLGASICGAVLGGASGL